MKRLFFYIAIGFIIMLVQSYFLGHFYSLKPDLTLVVLYYAGLTHGEGEGLLAGGILGIITDFFYGGVLGVNFISKAFAGYIAGSIGTNFQNINHTFNAISFFLVSIIELLTAAVLLHLFYDNVAIKDLFMEVVLPTAVSSTALMFLVNLCLIRRVSSIRES